MNNISGSVKNWGGAENSRPKQQKKVEKTLKKPKLDLTKAISKFEAYYKENPTNELSSVILNLERANKLLNN